MKTEASQDERRKRRKGEVELADEPREGRIVPESVERKERVDAEIRMVERTVLSLNEQSGLSRPSSLVVVRGQRARGREATSSTLWPPSVCHHSSDAHRLFSLIVRRRTFIPHADLPQIILSTRSRVQPPRPARPSHPAHVRRSISASLLRQEKVFRYEPHSDGMDVD